MAAMVAFRLPANIFPKICSDMHKAFLKNDLEKARELNQKLMPFHKALFLKPVHHQ